MKPETFANPRASPADIGFCALCADAMAGTTAAITVTANDRSLVSLFMCFTWVMRVTQQYTAVAMMQSRSVFGLLVGVKRSGQGLIAKC